MSKIHELNFLEPIWSQWPQISSPKLSLDEKSLPRKFFGRLDFTRFIDNPSRLLDDCCYSTRTYSTSTFTLPVLDLSLSSTMLFVDFMLFLGTTYIMYFYFPKLLEPFWSHLNSSTSTSICLSFYCNNSYEN